MGLFEAAKGGTVILDEVGDMSEDAQVHLLRVLQEHKVQRLGEFKSRDVDVRIIAITNRNLAAEVEAGRFREDLYYRLNVLHIHAPPLRDRVEDLPILSAHFLEQALQQMDKVINGFNPDVIDMFARYAWPGNVRELENEIFGAAAIAEAGERIEPHHFSPQLTGEETVVQEILTERVGLSAAIERFQRRMVVDALRACHGNRTQAARRLGMQRPSLVRLIKRLGIDLVS